jgi:hypothetical protein
LALNIPFYCSLMVKSYYICSSGVMNRKNFPSLS